MWNVSKNDEILDFKCIQFKADVFNILQYLFN